MVCTQVATSERMQIWVKALSEKHGTRIDLVRAPFLGSQLVLGPDLIHVGQSGSLIYVCGGWTPPDHSNVVWNIVLRG